MPRLNRSTPGSRSFGVGLALALTLSASPGCELLVTEAPESGDVLDGPLPDLPPELAAAFIRGDENFERAFAIADGLGPIFNDTGCASCHPGDGRGTPEQALVRFSRGLDLVPDEGGPQLQTRAIAGSRPEVLPEGVDVSLRLPPPVFGVGLIESIPVATILANADPDDADADGISGRPNWVAAAPFVPENAVGGGAGPQLGRFSRKAQVSSLLQQAVEAYHQDIGITTDFLPDENLNPQTGDGSAIGDGVPDPELPSTTVRETVTYIRLLAPPAPGPETAEVANGRTLFASIGCADCHVPVLRTGRREIEALSEKDVPLYSDLLLHDMGPGLADGRPDGDATGTEWRTAPLWGTRLVSEFLGGVEHFLHDGRAGSLDEAIRLHGGEADAAREAYLALSADGRRAVVAFVGSR